jgi:UDP-N-acetylglucosamine/UDP-N-acetylgalactosamine diphosphorylase
VFAADLPYDRPAMDLDARLQSLIARGIRIVDVRQTFVDADVHLDRISPGAVLYPGARLHGARTFLGTLATVGSEGPATLQDVVLATGAGIASGYAENAVLLRGARAGANAHLREGTLLEEEASTAHAVGLKQTILLSFVTLGSLINFCDLLMAGGSSRDDHSEVGSGFIHFNFTPWGRRGDKATPSLVGDVVRGVFLRHPRIFLGGAGGMVGPRAIGYGSVVGAGQVVRRDVAAGRLVVQRPPEVDVAVEQPEAGKAEGVTRRNVEYIAQLHALRAWYRDVRLPRAPADDPTARLVLEEAVVNIESGITERLKRLSSFLAERGRRLPALTPLEQPSCPLKLAGILPKVDHVAWVQALSPSDVDVLAAWLDAVTESVRGRLLA